ncbi:mitotic-spindle organizing protein 2 isoform X2 [Zonotrichia albicollis]|uniref:mitotic-spindle organizing protein 2 isoform X2 n=1 Tax=Zonotrichia albicollis TaxID=44394 RepID=UPI003D8107B2
MSEGPAGMAAPAAMAETRLRRKQLLSAEEAELFELAQAAGSGLDPEVFRVLLDLLRMNVAPLAVFQVLKSMCAGQRLPPAAESGPAAPAPIPADSRGFRATRNSWKRRKAVLLPLSPCAWWFLTLIQRFPSSRDGICVGR